MAFGRRRLAWVVILAYPEIAHTFIAPMEEIPPQPLKVPSDRNASPWSVPAAMVMTSLRSPGTLWLPQLTTVPSDFKA